VIKIRELAKSFEVKGGEKKVVLSSFSLNIEDKFYSIIGHNGGGKSTLLNIIAGMLIADKGKVIADKNPLKVGYIQQNYRAALLPWFNVLDNITFPLKIQKVSKKERYDKARQLVDLLINDYNIDLDFDFKKKVYELSGGQQQMINILQNIIIQPDILLLDEPFSALDPEKRNSMVLLMQKVLADLHIPILFVTHDIDEALLVGDEVIFLNNGCVDKKIQVELPRPRTIDTQTTAKYNDYRKEIIKLLF